MMDGVLNESENEHEREHGYVAHEQADCRRSFHCRLTAIHCVW